MRKGPKGEPIPERGEKKSTVIAAYTESMTVRVYNHAAASLGISLSDFVITALDKSMPELIEKGYIAEAMQVAWRDHMTAFEARAEDKKNKKSK